ncbi:hypothetical protein BKA64DRAFT_648745 [Cadophora sp. MPI-SDFR-AT-0126]|nr:hypothetical protein BKA64DRAFT_648745 [Leotiomycetes sp. MPI-SDFR-AT-0126]
MTSHHTDCINTSHNRFPVQDLATIQGTLNAQQRGQAQRDVQTKNTTQPSATSPNMGFPNLWSNDCPDSKDDKKKSNDSKLKPPALPRSKSSNSNKDKDTKSIPAPKTPKEPKPPKAPKAPKPPKQPKKPKEPKKSQDSRPEQSKKRSWFSLPRQYEPASLPVNLTKAPNSDTGVSIQWGKKGDDSKYVKSAAEGSKNTKAADRKAKKSKEQGSDGGNGCDCPHD